MSTRPKQQTYYKKLKQNIVGIFIVLTVGATGVAKENISVSTTNNPATPHQLASTYLPLDWPEISRQDQLRRKSIQEVAPVLLAESGETTYDHKHLGWPVAAMINDRILVAMKTWAGLESHSDGEMPYRGPFIIYSDDAGKTWSSPIYPHEQSNPEMFFTQHEGMLSLGITRSKKVVLITTGHVFLSDDKGETWTHYKSDSLADMASGYGPRIIDHPKYGLIRFGCKSGELSFFVSHDEGLTWNKELSVPVNESLFRIAEPTAFLYEDKFGLVTRNHSGPSTGSSENFRSWNFHAQFIPINHDSADSLEDVNFDHKFTNMSSGRRMDTNDAIYNPVSGRIEVVSSKRNEGFPYRDNDYATLNLWSIDPDRFFNGNADWRFECVLLRRKGTLSRSRSSHPDFPPRDGMHPAGSVVDETRGLQHIFIYSGDRTHLGPNTGKTGVFRLSRTLDTDALREASRKLDNFDKIFKVDEDFDTLDGWTLSGSPIMLQVDRSDRDIVHELKEPLPVGLVTSDEEGLYIKTDAPGYYGLHNKNNIVTQNYNLEFRTKIERYAINGDSLGICINYVGHKLHLTLREDGLYELESEVPYVAKRLKKKDMDNLWHTWNIEVRKGIAAIYLDDTHVVNTSLLIDDRLGHNDAPINIYVRTTDETDFAEVRMKYFKLENIETGDI